MKLNCSSNSEKMQYIETQERSTRPGLLEKTNMMAFNINNDR